MGKKKQEKIIEINRNQYNQIRKMDHRSMELCISRYYEQGFHAGEKAGGQAAKEAFDMELALELIGTIHGIGDKKLVSIRQSLITAGAKERTDTILEPSETVIS